MAKLKEPWLKEYKVFGIPATLEPYPDKPVYDILYRAAKKYKKMGLIQMKYMMTYPEVKNHADRLATAFCSMGLKKGDRVATILPTSIQFVIADYAISRAGLVHIPSSHLEPPEQLLHKYKEGGPGALISLDSYYESIKSTLKKVKIENIILTKLEDYSNHPPEKYDDIKIKGTYWLKDLIGKTVPNPPENTFDVNNDLETLLFTGGTTGLAKGCMLTHRNIYSNSIQNSYAMGKGAKLLSGCLTSLVATPFFHSYGHLAMHTLTMLGHNQILIPDPRDTASMVEMIKEYFPFMKLGVPTQFMMLIKEELEGISMIGVSGSAPLPRKTQEMFESKAASGIMEGYGLSEMSPVSHLNTSLMIRLLGGRTRMRITNAFLSIPGILFLINKSLQLIDSQKLGRLLQKVLSRLFKSTGGESKRSKDEKRGTIGIPYPDTMIKILDVEKGCELSREEMINEGRTGELCLNGPQRMLGYWPEPGTGIDQEGYIHTSDVVKIDERGYFYVVDRTKDMIIVSGYKVYSREIDDILAGHPDIDVAAAVGIPDPDREGSERVVVYVQPKKGAMKKVTPGMVTDYLKTRVARYAIPRVVEITDSIPLTEVQKVNKKVLREMARKEHAGAVKKKKTPAVPKKPAKKPDPKKQTGKKSGSKKTAGNRTKAKKKSK